MALDGALGARRFREDKFLIFFSAKKSANRPYMIARVCAPL